MARFRPSLSQIWTVALAIPAAGFLLLAGPGDRAAASGDTLRAGSVCEAQELKALKADDPHLEIEIPAEFDKQFPSLSACRSHEAAWDPEAPGPKQPIPFSHAHHAGEFEIECMYCHSGTDRSPSAGVPSVELCMGCHSAFGPEYDELEGIRILKKHWEDSEPIPWVQVHRLPEHVQFQHQRHVQAGFDCQECHGSVEDMDKLYLVPDTKWWQYGLPTKKLEMGWCIMCHRENEASQDCLTCHY
ncbi:MAG: cytochrome c family protein [Myxococcales bacterium]|nr:cytochrome c family protein [Myxococcales bacterium]